MPLYYRDHRRHPRVGVPWSVEVTAPDGETRFAFTAMNVSAGGMMLGGEAPVVFPLPEEVAGQGSEAVRFSLRLTLPGGEVVDGIQATQQWETLQEGRVLSGWRFVGLPVEAWDALREAAGLAVPGVEEPKCAQDAWEDDEVELWDYVQVLVRRRWTVMGCALLTAVAAFVYTWSQPALFTAEAQIVLVGEVDYLTRRAGLDVGRVGSTPHIAILKSFPLNRRVARRIYEIAAGDTVVEQTLVEHLHSQLEVQTRPEELNPAEWERRKEVRAVGWLRKRTTFEQGRTDRVITISSEAECAELAAGIANAYITELEDHVLRSSQGFTTQNLQMAQARLDTLERELEEAEKSLADFRTANQRLLRDESNVELLYPAVATQYGQLQRVLDPKQSLYNTVANQYELLRLQRSRTAAGVEIIAAAEVPLGSRKAYRKHVMLGGVTGLFAGVFLAFVLGYLGNKRSRGELALLRQAWRQDVDRLRRMLPL